jgi:aspartate/methionine/tyrosine aminotransferase
MIAPDRIQQLVLPPFDALNRRGAELRSQGHPVLFLGQAIPFFPPPPAALGAAQAAMSAAETHRYATDPGLPSLRRALAWRLGETLANHFDPEDVFITAGGNHAFALVLTTLVSAGDEVVLPGPYFANHHMMVRAVGATAVEAPVADRQTFAVRWSDIEPHLSARTRMIVLCNPSNPTGATLDPADGRGIIAEASARGVIVVSDEAYMHFVYDGAHWSAASVAGWRESVVVIGTLSKSLAMMGWRVGFVLADRAVCEQLEKVMDAMLICAPVISQVAAEAAVRTSWPYAAGFLDELRARRQVLAEGLGRIPGVAWTPGRAGLFAFARIAGCTDSMQLARDLMEEVYLVTIPGISFGQSGEGCLRLSFGFAAQDELREATRRLGLYFSRR